MRLKMAETPTKLLLLITIIGLVEKTQATFGIVEPFPENLYPLEFTSAQVTCVASDPTGKKVPSKILFMRRDEFHQYTELKEDGNIYFETRTEILGHNTKLFVTMHIRNVTLEHDSLFGYLGSYECHAFAVGDDARSARHGFSVSVIRRIEIPRVAVFPQVSVHSLQHNDSITLKCKMTDRGHGARTPMKRISWYKNGVLLDSVRLCPYWSNPLDDLSPVVLKNVRAEDGGNYTCVLEVALRNILPYRVYDHTVIHIAPSFEHQAKTEITKKPGESVKLECSAKGFPLNVEWRAKTNSHQTSPSCITSDGRFKITSKGENGPNYLTITSLVKANSGSYFCCLSSNCSANVDDDQCQRFDLTVRD